MRREVYSRPWPMPAIHERSAAELAAAYSPRRALAAGGRRARLLERIEAWEPRINAMYRVHREAALEQARASEARWRSRPRRCRALDGVPRHDQGEHLHARRSGADRHARQRGRAAAGGRRAAGGAAARGGLRDPRQDDDARLRHALLGAFQPARRDAQSLAPRPQSFGLELGRGAPPRSPATRRCTSAPTSAARCGCRRRIAASSRSSPRSAACRSIRPTWAASRAR